MSNIFTNRSPTSRFFLSAFPAIGMTCLLFFGMQALVKVDKVFFQKTEFRTLTRIVPPPEKPETPIPQDTAEIIKAVPPPKSTPIENTSSKAISWEVITPAPFTPNLPKRNLNELLRVNVSIDRQIAEPIQRPVPVYPEAALRKGLSGQCDVEFSIDRMGRPYGVEVKCSDNVFRRSAEQAVRKALFAARTQKGVPVGQENLVYPLLYELNDD